MLDSLICKKKVILTWHPIPFSLFHVYPFFIFCVWSRRKRTVRRWWACCQERPWVQKVSSCQSLCLRSTCPGCGWRNTLTRTVRSVSQSVFLSFSHVTVFFNHLSLSPLGLHVGFLSRLWHQLQFSIRWSRPVAGHVWVHEGRVSPHGPENRPPGPQNPRSQPPSQCHFIWHRSALSFLSFYVCSISGTK